ncbi:hypothetical protein SCE1572_48055 [Sorangium cellulosum So0157-2]|uniref:Uncharacterized protein n=1 Tax=Sorangium cellulosum So0157-2 TaxID=1254432 RepID=S4Y7Z6_SORCE|nr:hypothetical protein SCE1572_48055 [Sorangium cellulosum So0157-2]
MAFTAAAGAQAISLHEGARGEGARGGAPEQLLHERPRALTPPRRERPGRPAA